MPADQDAQKINEKLDLLLSRMEALERLVSTILGSPELVNALALLRLSGAIYRDYSVLSHRIAKAQKHLKKREIDSDELMRHILRVLVVQGPRNISEITRATRRIRGKASRTSISQKLQAMEKIGSVRRLGGSPIEKIYDIV